MSPQQVENTKQFSRLFDRIYGEVPADARDCNHRDVAIAQAALESAYFTSGVYEQCRNAFGMQPNRRGIASGVCDNSERSASYDSVADSIKDYLQRNQEFASRTLSDGRTLYQIGLRSDSSPEEYLAAQNPGVPGLDYNSNPGYTKSVLTVLQVMKDNKAIQVRGISGKAMLGVSLILGTVVSAANLPVGVRIVLTLASGVGAIVGLATKRAWLAWAGAVGLVGNVIALAVRKK